MARSYLTRSTTSPRRTPQNRAIPGREKDMTASAGGAGVAFKVGPLERLRRFVILGSEGGSYYASERKLTESNSANARRALDELGVEAVREVVEISEAGRAVRNDVAVYVIAMACAHRDEAVRRAALEAIPRVCRTGTHLFQFLGFVEEHRGWGRALKRAVAEWYTEKPVEKVAYQAVKYRQREGWTHKDALRLAKPRGRELEPERDALFAWITGKLPNPEKHGDALRSEPLRVLEAFALAQGSANPEMTARLVREYGGLLPREALLTDHLTSREVNEALVEVGMPMTALIRNLANLTRYEVLKPMGGGMTREVVAQITDADRLRKARVHPLAVLFALTTYEAGRGFRGANTWTPVAEVVDALNEAFYMAFEFVEPTEKRTMIAIDVSGSMSQAIANSHLSCAMASAAMAMVIEKVEPWTMTLGFHQGLIDLAITHKERLTDVTRRISGINYGGTDCSLPMIAAKEKGLEVDTFVVLTDNETWAGRMHPSQALAAYRKSSGIPARLVTVGMTAGEVSIADPDDAGMMDVVGFDTTAPSLIADFSAGRL